MRIMTGKDLAKRLNTDMRQLRRWTSAGLPSDVSDGKRLFDFKESAAWLLDNVVLPNAGGRGRKIRFAVDMLEDAGHALGLRGKVRSWDNPVIVAWVRGCAAGVSYENEMTFFAHGDLLDIDFEEPISPTLQTDRDHIAAKNA